LKRKVEFVQNSITADERKRAVLLTVLAGSLWGTSFPAIKIGLQYMDAYTFVFLRFFLASLVMFAIMLFTKNFSFNFSKKRLVLSLGISNGIAYLLQYIGMASASASESSLFVNLSVVWVALLAPIVSKERIGFKKVAGVTISLLGVVFMTTNLDFASLAWGDFFGDLLVIAAGLLWAIFIVFNKPLIEESRNMIQSMTWLLFFTMLPLIPVAPFLIGKSVSLPWDAWVAILYTAMFCWIIPYFLWLKGLKKISPVTSAVVLLTEILVAVAISTVILGEIITIVSGFGAILIITAILLVSIG